MKMAYQYGLVQRIVCIKICATRSAAGPDGNQGSDCWKTL